MLPTDRWVTSDWPRFKRMLDSEQVSGVWKTDCAVVDSLTVDCAFLGKTVAPDAQVEACRGAGCAREQGEIFC